MGNVCALITPRTLEECLEQHSWTHKNIGTMDNLHSKCTKLKPICFTGLRLEVAKNHEEELRISHIVQLPGDNGAVPVFRFSSVFFSDHPSHKSLMYPRILGEIGAQGRLHATFVHMIYEHLRGKYSIQVENSALSASELSFEYRSANSSISLQMLPTNIYKRSFNVVVQCLGAVTPHFEIGSKIELQIEPRIFNCQLANVSVGGRYTNGDAVCAGILSPSCLHVSYYKQMEESMEVGLELKTDIWSKQSIISLGYQIDIPKADAVFRGFIDSNANVCCMMEKRFKQFPLILMLSLDGIRKKNSYRIGCGVVFA